MVQYVQQPITNNYLLYNNQQPKADNIPDHNQQQFLDSHEYVKCNFVKCVHVATVSYNHGNIQMRLQ